MTVTTFSGVRSRHTDCLLWPISTENVANYSHFHALNVVWCRIWATITFSISDIKINCTVVSCYIMRCRRSECNPPDKVLLTTHTIIDLWSSHQVSILIVGWKWQKYGNICTRSSRSMTLPWPDCLSTKLSFYLHFSRVHLDSFFVLWNTKKRWKQVQMRVERESQRVSFKGGRTYYDYIYPKLENNEERLKPS